MKTSPQEADAGRAGTAPGSHTFGVAPEEAGPRLDVWLTRRLPGLSRARVQALIGGGHVAVNGVPGKEHRAVRAGDRIAVVVPTPTPSALTPEAIPLDVLYEDDDLLVLNKPAGLVVHPAAGHATGTLVHALLHHCGAALSVGGATRPGIVHRLDRDTSGVLVAAKTARAHAGLVDQFKRRRVDKRYVAVVWGVPCPACGSIETLIGRHPTDRKKMSACPRRGRPAVTRYEVVESFGPASLVRVQLETGRTHQIRVHMAHRGHPVVGDRQYGRRAAAPGAAPRQMLHAESLAFEHPVTGRRLTFQAPWPPDLCALVEALRHAAARTASTPAGHPL